MRSPRCDDDCEVANLEMTYPVMRGEGDDVVPAGDVTGDTGQLVGGGGMAGVIETSDGSALVVVAHQPDEKGDPADRGMAYSIEDVVHTEWSIGHRGVDEPVFGRKLHAVDLTFPLRKEAVPDGSRWSWPSGDGMVGRPDDLLGRCG